MEDIQPSVESPEEHAPALAEPDTAVVPSQVAAVLNGSKSNVLPLPEIFALFRGWLEKSPHMAEALALCNATSVDQLPEMYITVRKLAFLLGHNEKTLQRILASRPALRKEIQRNGSARPSAYLFADVLQMVWNVQQHMYEMIRLQPLPKISKEAVTAEYAGRMWAKVKLYLKQCHVIESPQTEALIKKRITSGRLQAQKFQEEWKERVLYDKEGIDACIAEIRGPEAGPAGEQAGVIGNEQINFAQSNDTTGDDANAQDNGSAFVINPTRSTKAKPGTEEKVLTLAARAAAGLPLWLPEDQTDHGLKESELQGVPEPTPAKPERLFPDDTAYEAEMEAEERDE